MLCILHIYFQKTTLDYFIFHDTIKMDYLMIIKFYFKRDGDVCPVS